MANPTGFYNLEKTGAQITKLLNDAQEAKNILDKKISISLENVEIAKRKNTTPVYISNILSGRKWNNITHIKDNK